MAVGDITLSSAARSNLVALQNTTKLLERTEERLSTGKKINGATDDATAYFASQGFLNSASNLSTIKDNLSTSLETVNSFVDSIDSVTDIIDQLKGLVTQALGSTNTTTRAGLASQFNALTTQLDQLVNDATFNGTNLLNSTTNKLTIYFNEGNTTALTITGVNITAAGLLGDTGKAAANAWVADTDIQTAQSYLLTAASTLTTDASNFGSNATLIETRESFTSNMISALQNASDCLVTCDTNEEGANLQALQAQAQLGITALGVSGSLSTAILNIL
ncbi:MAG: flagellin [Alphaproteobacteria bacterium]|nr:flagellin [Alphaproteobacteria bacterium]